MKNPTLFLLASLVLLAGYPSVAQHRHGHGYHHYHLVAELKEDFRLMRSKLENLHPGLYNYVEKDQLDHLLDSLYRGIENPMTGLQFQSYLSPLHSIIRDGHTRIVPGKKLRAHYDQHAPFFPFEVYWHKNKLYCIKNYSLESEIPDGAEIIQINKRSSDRIMTSLMRRTARDGSNFSYPRWQVSRQFAERYSYRFGHTPVFRMDVKMPDGKVKSFEIKALPKKIIEDNKRAKYGPEEPLGLSLVFSPDGKMATLTIRSFQNKLLRKKYKQKFKPFIRQAFEEIKKRNIENLVLDLRDNEGGEIENGKLLLSYLMDHPYRLIRKMEKVAPHPAPWKARLKSVSKTIEPLEEPGKSPYTGKLVVLINGGSFSCTAMVASCLDYYWRGSLVGQETGGNNRLFCGQTQQIKLRNTGLNLQVPTVQYYIIEEKENLYHGVTPEHLVVPAPQSKAEGRDDAYELALRLLELVF